MNNQDKLLCFLISDINSEVDKAKGTLIDKLKFAMAQTKHHWMITDEDIQFRGAVGAVMLSYEKESEEFKRLAWELQQVRKLNIILTSAQNHIPISLTDIIPNNKYQPIGLLKLWCEIK